MTPIYIMIKKLTLAILSPYHLSSFFSENRKIIQHLKENCNGWLSAEWIDQEDFSDLS